MPYPSLLHPEPLQQATADPYLHRRCSDTVLAQSLWIGNAFLCLFISKANHLISVIKVYAPTSNAEEAEGEWFYEDLQELLELIPKKDILFITLGRECKSRKSRAPWNNKQIRSPRKEMQKGKMVF